jgi:glycosyltransferase involved in cell wall biosynthesis
MMPQGDHRGDLPGISLVIPAFNEEARIRPTLERYLGTLENLVSSFEIIVIADGNDRTTDIANEFSKVRVKTHVSPQRLGKGGAILKGFRLATYPIIGYVDADGSLDSRDIERLIRTAVRDGCAIGSRRIVGSLWIGRNSWSHRLASKVYNILVRGVLGVPVRDTQCGAKFYSQSVLNAVLDHVQVTNMTVDTAILFHLRRQGRTITEVPVTWVDVPGSRFTLSSEVLVMLLTLVGIRLMNLGTKGQQPWRVVTLLSQKYKAV